MLLRHPANPLISPADVPPSLPDWEVIGTFNAGACIYGDEIILLLRVAERPVNDDDNIILCPDYVDSKVVIEEIRRDDPNWVTSDARLIHNPTTGDMRLTSISHLRLARSQDGITFTVDPLPWLRPGDAYEVGGVEDARITKIQDRYTINYTAVSSYGIATSLVSTADFVHIERHVVIFPPSNRDVTIFPEKINGQYVCYHRPMPGFGRLHMWIATSPDLKCWGNHQIVLKATDSGWMSGRLGGGAPPILTEAGWLSVFHAADKQQRYCLGAFVAAKNDPARIIKLIEQPILTPEAPYETGGFFGNVVFTCGAVQRDDQLLVYYGAADEHIALATADLNSLLA